MTRRTGFFSWLRSLVRNLTRGVRRDADLDADVRSYVDLLTAQRTNAQTNLAYVEALGDLWSAAAEIEGLLLRDSLETETAAPSPSR